MSLNADLAMPLEIAAADITTPAALLPADDRLSFLFRASLKEGRIHPLYLQMLRYRSAGGAAEPDRST